MALRLAAIDRRLSVLIRGDRGAGKSTAARGLVDLLAQGAPFVNLPIGATEDRLLGGLDIERALKGEPALKPGLLSDAHGGVLYIDEVNLLADHLADALLDTVASGLHVVEREGFSVTHETDFVLVGSMNPEEGALRPQLLDRFAFAVDVSAPMEPRLRSEVIARRLEYDRDPVSFAGVWSAQQARLADELNQARGRSLDVTLTRPLLEMISARIAERGVRSLRADLAVVRGSRALAALEGKTSVEEAHVEAVIRLALAHRTSRRSQSPPPESASGHERDKDVAENPSPHDDVERVFASSQQQVPRLVVQKTAETPGGAAGGELARRGVAVASRRTAAPKELDARASLRQAVSRGAEQVTVDDLHERVRAPRRGTRYVFVVDSSGSHAVRERMRAVKGIVSGVLEHADGRHDEVVLIVCRGASAQVLLEPTPIVDDARRAIEYLPTGGRTPLAHGIELAATYINDAAVVIVVTDGHANVPSRTDDPWADAVAAAKAIRCPSLVIDSEDVVNATGKPRELADAMGGVWTRLGDLGDQSLLHLAATSRAVPSHTWA
ncbi:MAG: VWA domain-containing protein [Vicinamibacterales bacterium]